MTSVDAVIDEIRREFAAEFAGEFERRLRARLMRQPTEWLVDELVARLGDTPLEWPLAALGSTTSTAPPAPAVDVVPPVYETVRETQTDRLARALRIQAMRLDEAYLRAFIGRCRELTRDRLEADGYLTSPPPKGSSLIGPTCRTPKGDALLREAKDLLDALLFGDTEAGVPLARVQRELLTITVARPKADTIACLLRAATEIDAEGTWRDPDRVADDNRAPNMLIEVEYGEVASEIVGRGIAVALRLINDLEINEQVLYARMENVEESSLDTLSLP